MSIAGGGKWEVTAAAPTFFRGDLQPITTEPFDGEQASLELLRAYFTRMPHMFFYGTRLRELLADNWDIVHCWEEPYVMAGGQVALWTPKYSRLVFWTGQTRVKYYPPPFAQIEKYSFNRSAGWLSRGQLGIDAMVARGHGDKPCEAIGLGVDLEVFHRKQEAGISIIRQLGWQERDAPIVGFTGRFVEEKGIGTLMTALDRIATPWRAIFLGAGPMRESIEQWASRHDDRVRIVAPVSHAQVPDYLNAFDVLCAPSRTTLGWREIFGRMVIEAFACQVPVIASDSGELPNVVADAGRIAGEDDVDAWTRMLTELLESPGLRAELAARGFERVNQHFTWRAIAAKHLRFFERLLDHPVG